MACMIRMPNDSFRGALPPLTDEQRRLEDDLRAAVQQLAGTIGERNLFHYKQLVAAAEYIHATLAGFGYEVRRQKYHVSGLACENLEAEILGTEKPEDILLIGAHYDSVQGSPGANDNATGVAWSDHWSFWKEGYPAVMVTDTAPNRYPHYHTTADTPDKVDHSRMARVVSGLLRVIEEVSGGSR